MAEGTLTVRFHEEDGSFWAEINELPGCFASGESMEELQEALSEAVSFYLSTPERHVRVLLNFWHRDAAAYPVDDDDEKYDEKRNVLICS